MDKKFTAIISILLFISIVINIKQYNANSNLKNEIDALKADFETLQSENQALQNSLESEKTNQSDLLEQIEGLQADLETLETENSSLSESKEALEKEIEARAKEEAERKAEAGNSSSSNGDSTVNNNNITETAQSPSSGEVAKPGDTTFKGLIIPGGNGGLTSGQTDGTARMDGGTGGVRLE